MTTIVKREQNGNALIETAPRPAVQVDTRETEVIPSEQTIDPFQTYQDKGGVFNRPTFYNVMFTLEDFMSGNVRAKAQELFSRALQSQPTSHAIKEKIILSDDQKWLYCLLRDSQVPIFQEPGEKDNNLIQWPDQRVFAEVIKLPSLEDWKKAPLSSFRQAV